MTLHQSVLPEEVIYYLNVRSNAHYIDCTFGAGGHTQSMLERNGPSGTVTAFDLDADAKERARDTVKKYRKRFTLIGENFAEIGAHQYLQPLAGILYDLGFSTDFLKTGGRGLSFQIDEPLDMRYSDATDLTAADILNRWSEKDIADTIFQYGEERYSRRIAKRIVDIRKKMPLLTTFDLVDSIRASVPAAYRHGRIHCATRTFQALRIAVNDELGSIERSLADALKILSPGGRLVVISFHSLEDRIVKRFFKEMQKEDQITILTKKPVTPSREEEKQNPASRSAKLRACEKK